jgi:hypothetical protein
MTHEPRRFLHVANGTSTTATIQAAGIPGTVSIWADPLYEGPVPGGIGDAELTEVRSRYLAGSAPPASVDAVNDLRRWRAVIEEHESYEELILWFEHDLFDQLNLIQLVTWIRDRLPPAKTVSLVCVGSFPGRPEFKGLGELRPGELASLLDTRQPVTDAQYRLAGQAWTAFRRPDPEGLDALRRSDTGAMPFLAAALKRFLEEYPSTFDGLSRSERRLLQLAAGGPVELRGAFPRMHVGEDAYYVTDLSFTGLVDSLSRTSPALIATSLDHGDNGCIPRGTMTLTDDGRAVLGGRLDRVHACGIDRWLGGVHLHAGADSWRWDDVRQAITTDLGRL